MYLLHLFLVLIIGNCVFSYPADPTLEKCLSHCEEEYGAVNEVDYETTQGGCTIECTCDGETETIYQDNFKKVGKKKVCFGGEAFLVADDRGWLIGLQVGDDPCDVTYYDRDNQEEIEGSESYTHNTKCYNKENDSEGKCLNRMCVSDDESYEYTEDYENQGGDYEVEISGNNVDNESGDDDNNGDGDENEDEGENGDDVENGNVDKPTRTGRKNLDADGAKQDAGDTAGVTDKADGATNAAGAGDTTEKATNAASTGDTTGKTTDAAGAGDTAGKATDAAGAGDTAGKATDAAGAGDTADKATDAADVSKATKAADTGKATDDGAGSGAAGAGDGTNKATSAASAAAAGAGDGTSKATSASSAAAAGAGDGTSKATSAASAGDKVGGMRKPIPAARKRRGALRFHAIEFNRLKELN